MAAQKSQMMRACSNFPGEIILRRPMLIYEPNLSLPPERLRGVKASVQN